MADQSVSDVLCCRLIIVWRNQADDIHVAVELDEKQFHLPTLKISRHFRLAAGLTLGIKERWGWTVVYTPIPILLDWENEPSFQYRVFECDGAQPPNATGICWKPYSSLFPSSFTDPADDQAVAAVLKHDRHGNGNSTPFGVLGWFDEVKLWIRDTIAPLGLNLTDEFQQWNAAPGFSLIRFETDKKAVWFKAAGHPNTHELPLTRELSVAFPEHNVRVLAEREEWKAWLSLEAEGTPLEEVSCGSAWLLAAKSLAHLQVASLERALRLLDRGAADLRLGRLLALIAPFFASAAGWVPGWQNPRHGQLSSEDLSLLEKQVRDAISGCLSFDIPDSLGHLDPNPGNMIVSCSGSCVFLDWAEGYVGFPFASFEYLLLHFRRSAQRAAIEESALQDSYWNAWKPFASEARLSMAKQWTGLLAVFIFAVHLYTRARFSQMLDRDTAELLGSLVRRMKREADLLGSNCPSAKPAI